MMGSSRGVQGWFTLSHAQVYHDHFVVAQLEEGIVVDLMGQGDGKPQVCMEMSYESARQLAETLLEAVETYAPKKAEALAN
jgi:hypothetical protein